MIPNFLQGKRTYNLCLIGSFEQHSFGAGFSYRNLDTEFLMSKLSLVQDSICSWDCHSLLLYAPPCKSVDDAWIGSWVQLSCQLLRVDSPLKKFPSQAESLWSVYEVTSRVPRNKIVKTSDVTARSSSIAARLTNPVFWQLIPVCFSIVSTNDISVIIKGRLPDDAKGFSTLSIQLQGSPWKKSPWPGCSKAGQVLTLG